jgi:glycosyltransferase involved in cell wall biosynthesis
MNIMIVSPTLNHGGAERVATLWAEGFKRQGHNVFFVANIEDEAAYSISADILPLTPARGSKLTRYIKSVFLLRSYFKKYHPDVIIGVMYACSLLAKLAEIGIGIPIINTEHSSFERPKDAPFSRIDWFAKFYFNYLYDGTTVLTEVDYQLISKRFKHVFVLPNPTFLTPLEIVPQEGNLILAAGRLDAWHYKGFDLLIKAWGLIKGENAVEQLEKCKRDVVACKIKDEGWRLQIAGTGSEESLEYLKQLCKENGVEDSVDFLGFVSDMRTLYKKASVFVLSSRYEGFGMVLIEAMSQGCACVACDYKGRQREIIQKDSQGLCCEPDNVEALAGSMTKMIEDDTFRKQVHIGSIERSRDFAIEEIMQKWEIILKNYV